jgi:hypothetical protein
MLNLLALKTLQLALVAAALFTRVWAGYFTVTLRLLAIGIDGLMGTTLPLLWRSLAL